MNNSVVNRVHMKQLDGLRAFAIFFTMVTHFVTDTDTTMGRLIPRNQLGVRPFFVISGFLITRILLRSRPESNKWHDVRMFYCRRILRIVPLYYATLAITALVNIRPVRQTAWWYVAYLGNFYQVLRDAFVHSVLVPYWSLSVEEQFYLVWPFLILFLPRRHLLKVMIATVCLGPLSRLIGVTMHIPAFGTLPTSCMDALGIGSILAYLRDRDLGNEVWASRFTEIMKWVGLPSFGLFFIVKAVGVRVPGTPVLADLAAAFAFGWLVSRASLSFRGPVGRILELEPVRYIGRISYGIYILHTFMPVILFYLLKWSHLTLRADSLFRFVVLLAMSVGAASMSWHFFESPINSYKRYFEYSRTRRQLQPAVSAANGETPRAIRRPIAASDPVPVP
jgi:peptidoglycan/LPS O-acetylase OafA/YrhL